jgi:hypothetical protein
MALESLRDDKNETLRNLLKKSVPPYTSDTLTGDLCEEVITSFGSVYPDEALSLCMKIAQRVASEKKLQEARGTNSKNETRLKRKRTKKRPR